MTFENLFKNWHTTNNLCSVRTNNYCKSSELHQQKDTRPNNHKHSIFKALFKIHSAYYNKHMFTFQIKRTKTWIWFTREKHMRHLNVLHRHGWGRHSYNEKYLTFGFGANLIKLTNNGKVQWQIRLDTHVWSWLNSMDFSKLHGFILFYFEDISKANNATSMFQWMFLFYYSFISSILHIILCLYNCSLFFLSALLIYINVCGAFVDIWFFFG